ncbi:MAG: caspase family protein [Syntrophales bacterium]|jgi:hypothetical protein|nr:caspase family protein [Syntrophales bacterium]MCK9390569.1 caspase family protein [Syntrophales bacterium]
MQTMLIRIVFILSILFLIRPSVLQAVTEQRTALVIGNSTYSTGPLKNPVNDATDMAATLQKLGFKVILKKNANLESMEEAIEDFGNRLKRGGVGLFYYAGHGVQVNGVNYLIPIGAKINKESDVRFKAFDAGRVLAEMENANNGLNIVLLDACRDNPFGKSFRSATRGLAIVSSAPAGTFISYSTGPGQVARDGEGRNSPYARALLEYVQEPGLTIEDVFKGVRQKLRKETGQVPWELSSLEGKFFFRPGSVTESAPVAGVPVVDYAAERRKIEEERKLLKQKAALEEERRKLEEEKQKLAMTKPPAAPSVTETGREGRFIAFSDGTVLDTRTKLMWAAKDNGNNVNYYSAKRYCDDYRGGGYNDWRMPTLDELKTLIDKNKKYQISNYNTNVHLTEFIKVSHYQLWASDPPFNWEGVKLNPWGYLIDFEHGWETKSFVNHDDARRALPVRSAK